MLTQRATCAQHDHDPFFQVSQALFAARGSAEPTGIQTENPPRDPLARCQRVEQAPLFRSEAKLDHMLDGMAVPEWDEQDVVLLHWRLLLELRRLPDPETPLEEKIDTLDWALTDPALDDRPFSFANCLRVVGTSPLSPTAYFGALQVDDIRDWLRSNAPKWIRATIARYPAWVQALIRSKPHWVLNQVVRNPQWINEQIKIHDETDQADLFGSAALTPSPAEAL